MRKPLRFPALCATCIFLLLVSASATRISGKVESPFTNGDSENTNLVSRTNSIFGFGPTGLLTYDIKITTRDSNPNCTDFRFSICEVSDSIVRDASFQRRQVPFGVDRIDETLAERTCSSQGSEGPDDDVGICQSNPIPLNMANSSGFSFANSDMFETPNMYIFTLASCSCENADNSTFDVEFKIEMRNLNTQNDQLGFEEAAFPILSAVVAGLLAVASLILVASVVFVYFRRPPVRQVLLLVLAACFLKALGATVSFLYYWNLSRNGQRAGWYTAARLLIAGSADIAYVASVMSFSTGYAIIPDNWFGEGRSPLFLIYIAITLQILITIAVKLMFPYRYLGMVTYVAAAGTIAIIAGIMSHRNYRFAQRFTLLIERSHIYAKTTPLPRMQRFYLVNIVIVSVFYLIKIIGLAIFDYNNERPDLLWGSFELADSVLLLWLTFCALPREKSAIYLDLSNVSDTRLHQADAWRASVAAAVQNAERAAGSRRSSNGSEVMSTAARVGSRETAEEANADNAAEDGVIITTDLEGGRARPVSGANANPQPPWVSWEPGMSLPRPDTATWGGRIEVRRILRREKKFVPVLPSSIVIGIPAETPDTVKLTVGKPTIGPGAVPKTFDEKGQEIIVPQSGEPSNAEAPPPPSVPAPPPPPVATPTIQRTEPAPEEQTTATRRRFFRFRRNRTENQPTTAETPATTSPGQQPQAADSSLLPQGSSVLRLRSDNDSGQLDLLSLASSTRSGDGRVFTFPDESEME